MNDKINQFIEQVEKNILNEHILGMEPFYIYIIVGKLESNNYFTTLAFKQSNEVIYKFTIEEIISFDLLLGIINCVLEKKYRIINLFGEDKYEFNICFSQIGKRLVKLFFGTNHLFKDDKAISLISDYKINLFSRYCMPNIIFESFKVRGLNLFEKAEQKYYAEKRINIVGSCSYDKLIDCILFFSEVQLKMLLLGILDDKTFCEVVSPLVGDFTQDAILSCTCSKRMAIVDSLSYDALFDCFSLFTEEQLRMLLLGILDDKTFCEIFSSLKAKLDVVSLSNSKKKDLRKVNKIDVRERGTYYCPKCQK